MSAASVEVHLGMGDLFVFLLTHNLIHISMKLSRNLQYAGKRCNPLRPGSNKRSIIHCLNKYELLLRPGLKELKMI